MEHATKCRNRSRVALSSIFHPLDSPEMQNRVSGSVCLKQAPHQPSIAAQDLRNLHLQLSPRTSPALLRQEEPLLH